MAPLPAGAPASWYSAPTGAPLSPAETAARPPATACGEPASAKRPDSEGTHAEDDHRHRWDAAAPDPEGRGGGVPLHESRLGRDGDLRGTGRGRRSAAGRR